MTGPDIAIITIVPLYFLGILPVDVRLVRRAGKLLRERHPDVWDALGVKSVHSIPFVVFLRSRAYRQLNDPDLTALLDFKRRFDLLTGLGFIVTMAVVLAWRRGMLFR